MIAFGRDEIPFLFAGIEAVSKTLHKLSPVIRRERFHSDKEGALFCTVAKKFPHEIVSARIGGIKK